jgi:energy-coupling factor transport system substrate-specific component
MVEMGKILEEFTSYAWILLVVGIGINVVGAFIAQSLRLPIWLDAIGTILVAVLAGPWVGAASGAATNIIKWVTFDPVGGPYALTQLAIGLAAGYAYKAGYYTKKSNIIQVLGVSFLIAIISTIISAPITVYLFGGVTGGGVDVITALLLGTGEGEDAMGGLLTAVFGSELIGDILDKTASVVLVFVIMQLLPNKYFQAGRKKRKR